MTFQVRPWVDRVIPSGQLRQVFTISERSSSTDALGERANTYTDQFTVRGFVRNARPTVRTDGMELRSEAAQMIRTRYRTGFKSGGQQRATDAETGKVYRIDTWDDVGKKQRWIDLMVVEIPIAEV